MTLAHASQSTLLALLACGAAATPASAGQRAHRTPFTGQTLVEPAFQTSWLALGSTPQTGEVVITEFMKDPTTVSDSHGEWIEVWNTLPWRCDLDGWTISDRSGSTHTLTSGVSTALIMPPGARFVLALDGNPATNGGVTVNYVYSGLSLSNSGADQIILSRADGTEVDSVDFDNVNYPHTPGRSIQLDFNHSSATYNDDPTEWCEGTLGWDPANTDLGTPGLPNEACP
jgi:hypothetical protein